MEGRKFTHLYDAIVIHIELQNHLVRSNVDLVRTVDVQKHTILVDAISKVIAIRYI